MTFWNTLGDYLGFFLWLVILFAYIMAVFTIFADLMRDPAVQGWAKAIWVVALVAVPFVAVIVYLIARGRGIGDRQAQAASDAKMATDAYIKRVAGLTPTDEIVKAKGLLDDGTITQDEFVRIKERALSTPAGM